MQTTAAKKNRKSFLSNLDFSWLSKVGESFLSVVPILLVVTIVYLTGIVPSFHLPAFVVFLVSAFFIGLGLTLFQIGCERSMSKIGFVIGETVRFGYFSQEGMAFDNRMKVIDVVRDIAETVDLGGGRRLTASQFLQHFLFPPEKQQTYVYKLSGGERRRLYLCTVLMGAPNFLVLDEPTNDLDITTLQILEEYLADFRGCVIVVSHDRYFMDKIVDHLLVFQGNGKVDDFPGNYTQYREWESAKRQEEEELKAKTAKKDKEPPAPAQNRRTHDESKRRLTYKERKEMETLETEIGQLETEKKEIETALCSGTLDVDELFATLDYVAERWGDCDMSGAVPAPLSHDI